MYKRQVRGARLFLSFDDTFGVDDVTPVSTPLSRDPSKAPASLEALAAICILSSLSGKY